MLAIPLIAHTNPFDDINRLATITIRLFVPAK